MTFDDDQLADDGSGDEVALPESSFEDAVDEAMSRLNPDELDRHLATMRTIIENIAELGSHPLLDEATMNVHRGIEAAESAKQKLFLALDHLSRMKDDPDADDASS